MDLPDRRPISKIIGAKIDSHDTDYSCAEIDQRFDITICGSSISKVAPHAAEAFDATAPDTIDARGCLVAPSLCHAHVHLDKCFLFNDPKYADLEVVKGDFAEALDLTSKAKHRFEEADLIRRGRWLIEESVAAGVTLMRVFVEVDVIVEFKCLSAATKLKALYQNCCHLQICAFAQDPIFSTERGEENRALLLLALQNPDIEVLGTTPYVETNDTATASNFEWALTTALNRKKHVDFHLDYNLSPSQKSWLPHVISSASIIGWNKSPHGKSTKTIALGHCTRMTLFDDEKLLLLSTAAANLPVFFIGLPTSDLYMMGRSESKRDDCVRGTLRIPHLISSYLIRGAISINNVGNAFTPYGNCDPLNIASLGVGLYHAGSKADARLLFECVSTKARIAIGEGDGEESDPIQKGKPANLVIFGSTEGANRDGKERRKGRGTLQEVIYDPPRERRTIYQGCLVSG